MIFFHKLYYNPNKKKSHSDVCPKPKKNINYTNYIMPKKKKKKHRKKFKNQILKLLNCKDLIFSTLFEKYIK
jgi:hypothetical protein